MAFVFKSEKTSIFPEATNTPCSSQKSDNTISNQQSQLNGNVYEQSPKNGSSPTKVRKGLPSLLNRHNRSAESVLENPFFDKENEEKTKRERKEKISINVNKLKKEAGQYVFTSNSVRQPFGVPFRPLSQNLDMGGSEEWLQEKEGIAAAMKSVKETTLSKFVNKSLLQTASQLKHKFKQPTINANTKSQELEKLLISSHGQSESMKDAIKNSPPKDFKKRSNLSIQYGNKFCPLLKSPDNECSNETEKPGFLTEAPSMNKTKEFLEKGMGTKMGGSKLLRERKVCNLKKAQLSSSFFKQESSDQEDDETCDTVCEDTPGPGTYNSSINLKEKRSFRSQKEKFARIFGSPLERFPETTAKCNEVTYVNDGRSQAKEPLVNQAFLSRSPKFITANNDRSDSPPPGCYNIRASIEHDVVRCLLKNANVANFSSSKPRFQYKQKPDPQPGPGDYEVDVAYQEKMREMRGNASSSYRSEVKRCLPYSDIDSVKQKLNSSELDLLVNKKVKESKAMVIHKREQHFDEEEFFKPCPFMSSVERFQSPPKYTDDNAPYNESMKYSDPLNRRDIKAGKQPFDSTQKRQCVGNIGEGVGVGSYNLGKDAWNKRSYNVYFH